MNKEDNHISFRKCVVFTSSSAVWYKRFFIERHFRNLQWLRNMLDVH